MISILSPFILLFDFVLSVPTGWLGSIVPAALLSLVLYLMAVLVTAVIFLIQHAIVWKKSWRWSWDAATTAFKPILLVFLVVGVFWLIKGSDPFINQISEATVRQVPLTTPNNNFTASFPLFPSFIW